MPMPGHSPHTSGTHCAAAAGPGERATIVGRAGSSFTHLNSNNFYYQTKAVAAMCVCEGTWSGVGRLGV